MTRPLVPILFALALASCSTKLPTPPVPPEAQVSKAQIAATEVSVIGAEQAAAACLKARKGPCATGPTRQTIILDAHEAHDAFRRLQGAAPNEQAAALVAVNAVLYRINAEVPRESQ